MEAISRRKVGSINTLWPRRAFVGFIFHLSSWSTMTSDQWPFCLAFVNFLSLQTTLKRSISIINEILDWISKCRSRNQLENDCSRPSLWFSQWRMAYGSSMSVRLTFSLRVYSSLLGCIHQLLGTTDGPSLPACLSSTGRVGQGENVLPS